MGDDPACQRLITSIDITITSVAWTQSQSIYATLFEKWSQHVCRTLILQGHYIVSVTLCDDNFIMQLNQQYRHQAKPTNILSFPTASSYKALHNHDHPIVLGDLVISFDTLEREANMQSKSFQDHLCHLWIHGLLHLLGYDHESSDEAEIMENLEINLLHQLNISNPYQSIGDTVTC